MHLHADRIHYTLHKTLEALIHHLFRMYRGRPTPEGLLQFEGCHFKGGSPQK
jgi:hypothetical protein